MTVPRFLEAKHQRKLCMVTAYDYLWASILDAAGVDALLVGDTVGMVVQGKSTTLPVTMDEIIYHAEMVVRATRQALVIADLPFMSFHISPQQALENAGRIVKESGATAVKLEVGLIQAEPIRTSTQADMPGMAHVGLKPQSVLKLGGYKIQRDQQQLIDDSLAAEEAGAFGIVLECVPRGIAEEITGRLKIPTIGIGAGAGCDGQVLVTPDMLGLTETQPRFVKVFADLRAATTTAVRQYIDEVRAGTYPGEAHSRN